MSLRSVAIIAASLVVLAGCAKTAPPATDAAANQAPFVPSIQLGSRRTTPATPTVSRRSTRKMQCSTFRGCLRPAAEQRFARRT